MDETRWIRFYTMELARMRAWRRLTPLVDKPVDPAVENSVDRSEERDYDIELRWDPQEEWAPYWSGIETLDSTRELLAEINTGSSYGGKYAKADKRIVLVEEIRTVVE